MKYLAVLGFLLICGCDASVTKETTVNGGEIVTFSAYGSQGAVTRIEQKDAVCFVMVGPNKGGISCISKKEQ